MLEYVSVFSTSGVVLWENSPSGATSGATGAAAAVDALVKTVLMEERGAALKQSRNRFESGPFACKWTTANDLELVFVCVYQKILQLLYVDKLLAALKKAFAAEFQDVLAEQRASVLTADLFVRLRRFDDIFQEKLRECERVAAQEKQKRQQTGPRDFSQTKKAAELRAARMEAEEAVTDSAGASATQADGSDGEGGDDLSELDPIAAARERFRRRREKKNQPRAKKATPPSVAKKPREGRKWDNGRATKRDLADLDKSDGSTIDSITTEEVGRIDLDNWSHVQADSSSEEEEDENKPSQGRFSSFFASLTGNKELTHEDLEPVMVNFKEHLTSRNVSTEVSEMLCNSVRDKLVSRKLAAMTSVKAAVRDALEEAIVSVLTPKRSVDILRDALAAQAEKRPYVIVFCGVNGVGKSTNLAKVTSWLQQQNLSVLLAACDTFRSGAVEQLEVHAKRLNVPLFSRGYRNDPTLIAADAIKEAADSGIDVVCVDTAGRMQDNDALMKALSKLVNVNKPDLVLFVGEALVGNDGVDQLTKFNRAMMDHATVSDPRLIDGIILTKFDTIDNKVGAAISMVYSTGIPIVFLGVGQHYTDLRRLNAKSITTSLLNGL